MTAIILSVAQITSSPLYGKDNSEKKDYVVVTKENSLSAIKKIPAAYRAGTKKLEGRILKARLTEFQAFELRKNRNIIAVEPDIMLKGSMESAENAPIEDKGKDAFWNSKMINAYCKDGKPSKRIKVALLDSGIDYFMQDDLHVKARKDFIREPHNIIMEDGSGHGTSIASVLIGNNKNVRGINRNIDLYSARILDGKLEAPLSRIIEAISWAKEQKVDIISISFGTQTQSKVLEEVINRVYHKGILIIAASGNAGLDKPDYPSGYKNVLSVGSVSSKAKRSSFSNKSDVLAPGQGIRANGAMGKTMITNGTSMAVPHVVGIASLLWEKNKKKTNTDIRNAIERSIHRGIIDYSYALKVLNKTNTSKQEKNNSIINTYDNSADETIYKGTWNTSEHNSFINNYLDKGSYYAVMMKQASYDADHLSDKIFGMNNHPEFHGYFQNVNHGKEDVNILSCYRMLIKIANEYGKGKDYRSISSSAGAGASSRSRERIKNMFKLCLDAITSHYEYNSEKKAYVFGIAFHTATDYLSHSTYARFENSWWGRLTHTKAKYFTPRGNDGNCDDPTNYSNRAKLADRIGRNIVWRFLGKRGDVAVAHDFHWAGGGYYKEDEAKNDFRIANITYYYYIQVKELNSTRDEAVKKHYEQINITVNKGKVVRE
ncbi:S8 family peptidase [Eggerthia catenaformis]|uniref:S8 family peptidase n=1 Tax=Eggerthia catenaformis TaxID=31973 RepID=UPI003C7042D5